MLSSLSTGGGGVSGGASGPATATSSNNAGQSVGGLTMGSPSGVSPWLLIGIAIVIAAVVVKR
ncbi:hypothetical protein [Vibrio cortegadensis]|uniref:hypothetical protein n=1 Tax=Vibrio cortegadensis TaxID=1328770 RepID=UPI00352EC0FD